MQEKASDASRAGGSGIIYLFVSTVMKTEWLRPQADGRLLLNVADKHHSLLFYVVSGTAEAVGDIAKRTFELPRFLRSETTFATVAVDAVKLVVKP